MRPSIVPLLACVTLAACADSTTATPAIDAAADVVAAPDLPASDRGSQDAATIDASAPDVPSPIDAPTDVAPPRDAPAIDLPIADVSITDVPIADVPAADAPAADTPLVCAAGTASCDGDDRNGCETTLQRDSLNCGACGVRCCGPCIDGNCWADGLGVTICSQGPDGCRNFPRYLDRDPLACGRCDNVCPGGPGATAVCVSGVCGLACASGRANCDGAAGNGCEADTRGSVAHCGACNRACGAGEVCDAGTCAPLASCKAIRDAGRAQGDGVYAIRVGGATAQVRCLMSADGGGWTQVMNFPAGATPATAPGWNAGAVVGADLTTPAAAWRMSDAQINALRTEAFRARGTASRCIGGACAIDETLYWRGACVFGSAAATADCATAFFDLGFTRPTGNSAPCAWHAGLVDTRCGVAGGIITNHQSDGIVVCTGDPRSFAHACSERGGEDPGLQVWVR